MGSFLLATGVLVTSDIGQEDLAFSQHFQFIRKEFRGVEVRAQSRPLEFLHTQLVNLCLYGPHFLESHAGTRNGFPQTVAT